MRLRNFDKSLFPAQGYFGVAVKRSNDIRSFTLAAGWNGLNSLSITTFNISASDFPDEVPQEFRRVTNSEISIHKDIKGVLSDSVYSLYFHLMLLHLYLWLFFLWLILQLIEYYSLNFYLI